MNRLYIFIFSCLVLSLSFPTANAQDSTKNKYGLWVISSKKVFIKTTIGQPAKNMVDLKKAIPSLLLDLKYSSSDNFMGKPLYPALKTTYLRSKAVQALKSVQQELNDKNLGLQIWDAYRPYAVTEKMWEPVKDDRYAADPKTGSGHNRGVAVDLTIIDLSTGMPLDMGTGFDNFSDTAHQDFKNLPAKVLSNRLLLRTVMEKYGFVALETEWWHYFLANPKTYELLNLSFKDLAKLNK
ncbi:MAG: peptidase vanX D-ala-D-ala dipeptidase [Ferruginibacter sp.]|nr:peptidase vanX D-ala-D-ala dipeptidase [Ferruginibacter sp.]